MEYMAFQNCMNFLLVMAGLIISTFISDRHTSIAKHMREKLSHITHYFDLWHLKATMSLLCSFVNMFLKRQFGDGNNW